MEIDEFQLFLFSWMIRFELSGIQLRECEGCWWVQRWFVILLSLILLINFNWLHHVLGIPTWDWLNMEHIWYLSSCLSHRTEKLSKHSYFILHANSVSTAPIKSGIIFRHFNIPNRDSSLWLTITQALVRFQMIAHNISHSHQYGKSLTILLFAIFIVCTYNFNRTET